MCIRPQTSHPVVLKEAAEKAKIELSASLRTDQSINTLESGPIALRYSVRLYQVGGPGFDSCSGQFVEISFSSINVGDCVSLVARMSTSMEEPPH